MIPMDNDKWTELFSENCAAKIWRVAVELLRDEKQPDLFPDYVPSTGDNRGKYITREPEFWTCGFLPGCLYVILERYTRFPKHLLLPKSTDHSIFHDRLLNLCRAWSAPLHEMAHRRDTHDLGFMVMPALRMDWELTANRRSLDSILIAGESLASRFDERVKAIRSWDQIFSTRYSFTDMNADFLVIVDSMCNLDLLFYAGYHNSNQRFIDIATTHAHTIRRALVRDDYSTYHVCNFDQKTGSIKAWFTHEGYKDDSTWTQGHAWAILGFTQTYLWTKKPVFLETAISLSDYFLKRLASSSIPYPYVPSWDFDDASPSAPRDTSAGMIAANGLLLLHQILSASASSPPPYLSAVLNIINDTLGYSLASDRAEFTHRADGEVTVEREGESWDAILAESTVNNNEFALEKLSRHGSIYADYYFLELGSKLLRMGLV